LAVASASPRPGVTDGGSVASEAGLSSGAEQKWLAPRLEIACHICMCVTMGYMLVLML
jgi:hypothetical protein